MQINYQQKEDFLLATTYILPVIVQNIKQAAKDTF